MDFPYQILLRTGQGATCFNSSKYYRYTHTVPVLVLAFKMQCLCQDQNQWLGHTSQRTKPDYGTVLFLIVGHLQASNFGLDFRETLFYRRVFINVCCQ